MLYELLGKARTVLEADNGRQSKKLEWMEWMDTPKTVMTTRAPAVLTRNQYHLHSQL